MCIRVSKPDFSLVRDLFFTVHRLSCHSAVKTLVGKTAVSTQYLFNQSPHVSKSIKHLNNWLAANTRVIVSARTFVVQHVHKHPTCKHYTSTVESALFNDLTSHYPEGNEGYSIIIIHHYVRFGVHKSKLITSYKLQYT